ncbi:hypothetical protein ACKQTC_06275 [Peptococcus simiae]|uniref:ABC transporter permease n=1 Tax=Peptococcus simiae TaxID=1643805 RepID=A0ABW9GZD1_9FIRM
MTPKSSHFSFSRSLGLYLKAYWWLGLLSGLFMLLAGPVLAYFSLYSIRSTLQLADRAGAYRQLTEGGLYLPGMLVAVMLGLAFAFIFSAYQHDRVQVDYRHALPVKRTSWMVLYSTAGLLIFAGVLLVMGAASYIICRAFYPDMSLVLHLRFMLETLIFYLAAYAVTLLAGQLTGNMVGHVGMAALFHLGLPTVALILTLWMQMELDTFVSVDWLDKLAMWSLPTLLLTGLDYGEGGIALLPMGTRLWLLAVIILALALSLVLYRRRPSERSGYTFIYPVTEYPVKGLVVVAGTLLAGLAFYSMTEDAVPAFIVGLIIGGVILHVILSLLFHRNVHQLHRGLIATGICILISFGIFQVLHQDIFGFDDYLPEDQDVRQVIVTDASGNRTLIENPKQEVRLSGPLLPQGLTLAKNLQAGYAKDADRVQAGRLAEEALEGGQVTWKLDNGQTIVRRYTMDRPSLNEAYAPVYADDAYRARLYKDLFSEDLPKKLESLSLQYKQVLYHGEPNVRDTYTTNPVGGQPVSGAEIITALKEDLAARRQFIRQEPPVAELIFAPRLEDGGNYEKQSAFNMEIPIYADDQALMALLNRLTLTGHLDGPEDLADPGLQPGSLTLRKAVDGEEVLQVTDPAAIRDLLPFTVPEYLIGPGLDYNKAYTLDGGGLIDVLYVLRGHEPQGLEKGQN